MKIVTLFISNNNNRVVIVKKWPDANLKMLN